MKQIDLNQVKDYVKDRIGTFHQKRLKCLEDTQLSSLLMRKNPYLFRAKNILTAQDLITALLDARLSSSEEEIFSEFLEDLSIFVAQKTLNATKSSTNGLDFEYTANKVRHLVAIKSGLNWGNSSQWKSLVESCKQKEYFNSHGIQKR